MNRLKTLKDRVRRLLALLSLGVLFFSSCSLADMIEFRDADSGPAPYHAAETETPKEPADLVHETIPIENETDAQPDANPDPETDADENAAAWIARYEGLFGEGAADEVLLTSEEIAVYNRRIIEECPTVIDIASVPEAVVGDDRLRETACSPVTDAEFYDAEGNVIDFSPIFENAAPGNIPDTITPRTAVVTKRCSCTSLPTSLGVYDNGDTYYSKIQLTELIVGMPVWVLHESADGAFLFVQSYYYIGWIPSDAAALCDAEDYERFAKPEDPVVVLRHAVPCGEIVLDMGAALPFRAETETGWTVSLPTRDEDGRLALVDFELHRDEAIHGYLPYTMRNTYTQAFACLGIPYGWGGTDGGLDCSGFVCAVFRTFGIYLPRDTRDQKDHAGIAHTGMTEEETERLLKESRFPVCLYSPGHVMLYLGEEDGTPTVIHAPQGGETVTLAPLEQERTLISLVEMK
ncbi:MAG: SH3 domain-containing protein [Clostridia bacterium]|nr:SH3 domain-containing protein [Clostridia bacterium]